MSYAFRLAPALMRLDLKDPKDPPSRGCNDIMKVAALSHALGPSLAAIAAASDLVWWGFCRRASNPFSGAIRFSLTGPYYAPEAHDSVYYVGSLLCIYSLGTGTY